MTKASEYAPFVIGTYEEALTHVGRSRGPIVADVPIEIGLVKGLASLVEDGCPAYWQDGPSGGAPSSAQPAILLAIFSPLRWHPTTAPMTILGASIPLPGSSMINVECEHVFEMPLSVGQWLSVTEWVTEVSTLKTTRLGMGHFVTTAMNFVDISNDRVVARSMNTLFRFDEVLAR